MNEWSNTKLCDVANLILGAVLLSAPWLYAFPPGAASQNAMVTGLVIVVLSIASLAAFAIWEEWLNLIVGLWAIVSPWVLGFQGTVAMNVHLVIGGIVAVLAAIELYIMHRRPPHQTLAH
jgi:hypothetical protein